MNRLIWIVIAASLAYDALYHRSIKIDVQNYFGLLAEFGLIVIASYPVKITPKYDELPIVIRRLNASYHGSLSIAMRNTLRDVTM